MADQYNNLMNGDLSQVDLSGTLGGFDNFSQKWDAYLKLSTQSGSMSAPDRTAYMETLGISSMDELATMGMALAFQKQQLDNTIAAMMNVVGVDAGTTVEQLRELEANADGTMKVLYNWLIQLMNVGNQISTDNPFMDLANTVLGDKNVLLDERIGYVQGLIDNSGAEGGFSEEGFTNFQNMITTLQASGGLEAFANAIGASQEKLIGLASSGGTAA